MPVDGIPSPRCPRRDQASDVAVGLLTPVRRLWPLFLRHLQSELLQPLRAHVYVQAKGPAGSLPEGRAGSAWRHRAFEALSEAFIVDRAFLRVEADDQIEAIIPGDLWHLAKDKPESLPCLFRHGVQAPHSSDFDVGSGPSGNGFLPLGSTSCN
ncbi:unnamed protein product [Polarella glacialis]|uniref:Uncharacterized protein n=1 Tax=Polarella glacialis TaxID=89957 RepID=A0A813IF75_POLGL|nr:unnamed protein product [Polarella glacialis]